MPVEERRARIEGIRAQVREHDLSAWVEAQLAALDGVAVPARR
jgi:trehalose-6-phosphate synthase